MIEMKTLLNNLIAIIKLSLAILLLVAYLSCSKSSLPKCEKWEVKEEGTLKCLIDFSCVSRTRQILLCGDALKDASAGNIVIIRDDDCCRTTRTFIRIVP